MMIDLRTAIPYNCAYGVCRRDRKSEFPGEIFHEKMYLPIRRVKDTPIQGWDPGEFEKPVLE